MFGKNRRIKKCPIQYIFVTPPNEAARLGPMLQLVEQSAIDPKLVSSNPVAPGTR
jgi:hypothetical protein